MIVNFEKHPKTVALFGQVTLIMLRTVPCQRALERDRNVRCQRTKQFDIFGDKVLSPFLCHYKNSVSFLRGRHWKHIGASAD